MTTATTSLRADARERGPREPLRFRVAAWLTVGVALTILITGLTWGGAKEELSIELIWWLVLLIGINLAPVVRGPGPRLDVDLPVLLAAAFLFGPVVAGLLSFVAVVDPREWNGGISLASAAFNRAQRALCDSAAGSVFWAFGVDASEWPAAIVGALCAVAAGILANYVFMSLILPLTSDVSIWQALNSMRLGSFRDFLVTYSAFGLLGLVMSVVYLQVGAWGLVAFLIPVVIARQAFSSSERLEQADHELQEREQVLRRISEQIAEERTDERQRIASSLHDDVLQSLHYLTLHAQVIREDLRHGRLLQLEEDIPALLSVSQQTADLTRGVVKDLRASPLGRGGVGATLVALTRDLGGQSGARIETDIGQVGGEPALQTLVYQVAREALTNAVRHSGAERISVIVRDDGDFVQLVVEDNGSGFDPAQVDSESHFGLELMRERVEVTGGSLSMRTEPGLGTSIRASFPRDTAHE